MWQKNVGLGKYDKRIEAYFKVFNSSQFHFVDGENMISRPWVEVEEIEEFLGVEKIVSTKIYFFSRYNHSMLRNGFLGSRFSILSEIDNSQKSWG